MHPLVIYTVKTIICSGLLVGYYWLALRNRIFHQYNRFYLLAAIVLSLLLPQVKINVLHQQETAMPVIKLLQAVDVSNDAPPELMPIAVTGSITPDQVAACIYVIVCSIFLLAFILSFFKIFRLYQQHEAKQMDDIRLIQTNARGTPFSFFKFIFWNSNIDLYSTTGKQILQHEIVHVRERHSYDKVFINLVLTVFWINPFFWIIRKELGMIHEFTADKKSLENNADTSAFAAMILQATYPQQRFDITNSFFYSPIKRRLMMLTKNKERAGYISRLMVLPLTVFVFAAFTLKPQQVVLSPKFRDKKITVVIDAGHGGYDAGASGNGLSEKDITLAIVKKIKALNTNNNINIILTRETDMYLSPDERTIFVNQSGAELAISIHLDGATKDSSGIKSGMTVWVSRDEYTNAAGSKLAASAIIQSFKSNYPLHISPAPLQRKNSIKILQASKCPAVLIEAGFITNEKDAAYLQSGEGQQNIAANILNAIEQYAGPGSKSMKKAAASEPVVSVIRTSNKTDTGIF